MRKFIPLLLLLGSTLFAQSAQTLTIPAQTFQTPVVFNGTTYQVTITVPSQTVTLPTVTATLPTGLTYAINVLTVAGGISTPALTLTGGPTLPACASGFYLWSLNTTTSILTPSCYSPPALTVPPIAVSQAAPPAVNTFTVLP